MLVYKLFNFIIFQTGWIIAVYYHNDLAALVAIFLACVNIYFPDKKIFPKIYLILLITSIGIINDYILFKLNIINFSNQFFIFFPLWLVALWLLFASTLHSSLGWLIRIPLIYQAILGGLGGSLSYIVGAKLNALIYSFDLIPAIIFHFINWFILFPLIARLLPSDYATL